MTCFCNTSRAFILSPAGIRHCSDHTVGEINVQPVHVANRVEVKYVLIEVRDPYIGLYCNWQFDQLRRLGAAM
jgi:hypothetical protein